MPKFEVETHIEVEAADEDDARRRADDLLQRLWDRDHAGSRPIPDWNFTIYIYDDGAVRKVPDD